MATHIFQRKERIKIYFYINKNMKYDLEGYFQNNIIEISINKLTKIFRGIGYTFEDKDNSIKVSNISNSF